MTPKLTLALLASALVVPTAGCGSTSANPIESGGSGGAATTGSTSPTGTGGSGGSAASACDPVCGSGEVCVEGACHAIKKLASASIGDGPCSMIVDDTNVYWGGNPVESVPKAGGQVTLYAWTSQSVGLAVDSTYLYYSGTSQGIERAAKTGGANGMDFGVPFADQGGTPGLLAGDGATIYYLDPASDPVNTAGAPSVNQAPTSNPDDPPPTVFSADWAGFGSIAVDATSVYYWGNAGSALVRQDKATLATTLLAQEGVPFDLYIGAASVIVPDGDTVFYSTTPEPGTGGVVAKVSSGGGSSTVVVDSSIGASGVFAVDADAVWFMTPSGVMKVSKAGGSPVMVSPLDPPSPFPSCMAVDDTYVYWIDGVTLMQYRK